MDRFETVYMTEAQILNIYAKNIRDLKRCVKMHNLDIIFLAIGVMSIKFGVKAMNEKITKLEKEVESLKREAEEKEEFDILD